MKDAYGIVSKKCGTREVNFVAEIKMNFNVVNWMKISSYLTDLVVKIDAGIASVIPAFGSFRPHLPRHCSEPQQADGRQLKSEELPKWRE